ncbi:hypothetical protein [Gluconobacter sphaericus]|uniref:Uncharacterized protein n=1 Tax=Gluconobacter sphaericus NBRC 12467 TaxID=1307951 RepID=A0AA37SKJ4_9PROT|nr:hypothetical protein [Gluconobacter sphaericus]MBF0885556.1 hypothetical protein [Gluconobacter sphaericus]GBR56541.1 hypothetical protein AA12467_2660 [Gluconobacter sphaericus NBRC 12467]GEB43680.1 hypothetical protein GSP01_24620 [Gluconobacter sphaericus NBRC 12467]GLQ86308.1 hypothetical protein GCM10007872_32230 [Gluconobacter sphaericus NBRC 12467]
MAESLADLAAKIEEHSAVIATHTGDIADLKSSLDQTQKTLAAMSEKQAEFHGENRARSEHQERTSREAAEKTQSAVKSLADQVARLGSVRGWVGWAVVTATSAGVATVISHLAIHP